VARRAVAERAMAGQIEEAELAVAATMAAFRAGKAPQFALSTASESLRRGSPIGRPWCQRM
jgi:hypothetical protein